MLDKYEPNSGFKGEYQQRQLMLHFLRSKVVVMKQLYFIFVKNVVSTFSVSVFNFFYLPDCHYFPWYDSGKMYVHSSFTKIRQYSNLMTKTVQN